MAVFGCMTCIDLLWICIYFTPCRQWLGHIGVVILRHSSVCHTGKMHVAQHEYLIQSHYYDIGTIRKLGLTKINHLSSSPAHLDEIESEILRPRGQDANNLSLGLYNVFYEIQKLIPILGWFSMKYLNLKWKEYDDWYS